MSAFNGLSLSAWPGLVRQIIEDAPTTVTVEYEYSEDEYRDDQTVILGPYQCRIEPFRHTTVPTYFDEKGSASTSAYVLLAVDIPAGVFKLDRKVRQALGTRSFRVTNVEEREGITQVNLNLEVE